MSSKAGCHSGATRNRVDVVPSIRRAHVHTQAHTCSVSSLANASRRGKILVARVRLCVEAIIGERAAGERASEARRGETRRRKYERVFLMNPAVDARASMRTRRVSHVRAAPLSTLATSITSARAGDSGALFLYSSSRSSRTIREPCGGIISDCNESVRVSPAFSGNSRFYFN